MTNKTQIADLRKLGASVSQGKWWMDSHGEAMVCFHEDGGTQIILKPEHLREKPHRDENTGCLSYWPNDSDASWIVAAQPKNILPLLDQLEATQGGAAEAIRDCLRLKESLKAVTEELAKEKEHSANFEQEANLYHGKCEAAEARIAELEVKSEEVNGWYVKMKNRMLAAEAELAKLKRGAVDALTKDIENLIKINSELAGESEELRAKLAALRGDAVPVAYIIKAPIGDSVQRVISEQDAAYLERKGYTAEPLFTHAQPVPLVVLQCLKCKGRGAYYCPKMRGTVECECGLKSADGEGE